VDSRLAVALALSLAPVGCSLRLSATEDAQVIANQCTADSDCGDGACWSGACVAHEGSLSALLFEVIPPLSAQGVGGVRFLQTVTDLGRSSEDFRLNLDRVSTVHGFVRAYDSSGQGCGAGDTLPVEVTLTPREQSFGLPSVSYVARTEAKGVSSSCSKSHPGSTTVQEFVVDVPAGQYDVYVAPLSSGATGAAPPPGPDGGVAPPCELIPVLIRGRVVEVGDSCLSVRPPLPTELSIDVPWPSTAPPLEGWTVDIVHPITGQLLSDRQILHDAPGTTESGVGYHATLRYSAITQEGSLQPGRELVRLSPPKGTIGPVVQLELAGLLQIFSSTRKAVIPGLVPFPAPVALDWWMWRDGDVGVPGTVTFTATRLDAIPAGIFASFSTTATVGEDGRVQAVVLPGDYRVRATPLTGRGYAATDLAFSVPCVHERAAPSRCVPGDPSLAPAKQAGTVIRVPPAATLTGEVVSPVGGRRLDTAAVQVLPASIGVRSCAQGGDAATCAAEPLGVIDVSLAEDAFVPRPLGGVVSAGRFTLAGVDCGGCTPGESAFVDFSVRPSGQSRLPWFVKPGLSVAGDTSLGRLTVPLPILRRGSVQVPVPLKEAVPVPGALIRVYVVRNALGEAIADPAGLPSCASGTGSSARGAECIRSVLQVAETRASGADSAGAKGGSFELVLPSRLE
jgi:hypothetical protein